jgi:polar amino acid transport system substrate-binding protein
MPFLPMRLFALSLVLLACTSHAAAGADRKEPPRELVVVTKVQVFPTQVRRPAGEHFQKSLGRALAVAAGRPVRFLELPRNRMTAALEAGDGDLLCGYLPAWLPGALDWSKGFIPVTDVVVSSDRVPALHAIAELKGKRIGTVLGFRYPDFEQALGAGFVRDDGPSESLSLQKMIAGRFDYVIATMATVHSQTERGVLPPSANVLVVRDFKTMCAISRRGHVTPAELNAAIDIIERNGELERLLRTR